MIKTLLLWILALFCFHFWRIWKRLKKISDTITNKCTGSKTVIFERRFITGKTFNLLISKLSTDVSSPVNIVMPSYAQALFPIPKNALPIVLATSGVLHWEMKIMRVDPIQFIFSEMGGLYHDIISEISSFVDKPELGIIY